MKTSTNRPVARWTVIVLVALAAGVLGQVLTFNYLFSTYKAPIQPVVHQQPQELPSDLVSQGDILRASAMQLAVVAVESDSDPEERARAVALTDDGWLAAPRAAVAEPQGLAVRDDQGRVLAIEQVVSHERTPMALVKVQAQDLPVAELADTDTLGLGQSIWSVGSDLSLAFGRVTDLAYASSDEPAGAIRSSEAFYAHLGVGMVGTELSLGSAVLDGDSRVIGFWVAPGEAVPADTIARSLESALQGQDDLPYLGIRFRDLVEALASGSDTPRRGALITQVTPDSPAAEAGLRAGDILTKVEQETISLRHTLPRIIDAYDPGTLLNLTVLRDGAEQAVEVTLGRA